MIWVAEAQALPGCRLRLRFSDGVEGEIDLREFIDTDPRPTVSVLRDPKRFANITVVLGTVVLGNGFDLAPEFLRERATVVK